MSLLDRDADDDRPSPFEFFYDLAHLEYECEDERCRELGSSLDACPECRVLVCPEDLCQHAKRCARDRRNRELRILERDMVRL